MKVSRQFRCSVGLALLAGCSADEALTAGVNTALNVGLTAAHIAATGGCWGACAYGTHCDEPSAVCVPDREEDLTRNRDPVGDPSPQLPLPPVPRETGEPTSVCEVSGGSCVDEGAVCSIAKAECVGQCRCIGLSWQCLESCR